MNGRARSIVAIVFAVTISLAVLLPILSRVLDPAGAPALPESVSGGLVRLVDMMIGSLATLLGLAPEKA
jgi:hypothetical protein